MFMKKTLAILLSLCMLLALFSGCTTQPTNPKEPTPPTEKKDESLKAEVTFWCVPLLAELEDILQKGWITPFNTTYPDVKVNLEMLTWDGVAEKLQIALGTGSTPDLYVDGMARMAPLPGQNVLADVTDVVAANPNLAENLTSIGKLDGKNYLTPFNGMTGMCMTVNATLAKKFGTYDMLPADKMSWTYEDFYSFVKACTEAGKADGVYGTALWAGSQSSDFSMYSMMLANGGNVLSPDKKTCIANEAPCVAIIDVMGRLVSEGYTVPGAATLKDEDTVGMFYNQKTVVEMTNSPIVNITFLKGESPDTEFEIFAFPSLDGKPGGKTASWGENAFAVFKNGNDENKIKASKALINTYYQRTDMIADICKNAGYASPIKGIDLTFTDDPFMTQQFKLLSDITAKSVCDFGLMEPYWPEIRTFFYPEVQSVYSGTKTAQEAMDAFKKNVDAVLAKQ